jgi:hypothetical protein
MLVVWPPRRFLKIPTLRLRAAGNPHPSTSLRAGFLAQRTREKCGTRFDTHKASSHQAEARARGDAAGLREFAAAAVWSVDGGGIVAASAGRGLGEFYGFDLEGYKILEVEVRGFECLRVRNRRFAAAIVGRYFLSGHGDVDVLEDAARGYAEHAIEGFDEVVAFAAGMLAAEMIDEGETGSELFGLYQETRAVRLPFFRFHVALPRVLGYPRQPVESDGQPAGAGGTK